MGGFVLLELGLKTLQASTNVYMASKYKNPKVLIFLKIFRKIFSIFSSPFACSPSILVSGKHHNAHSQAEGQK